jgi:hypothetical protein
MKYPLSYYKIINSILCEIILKQDIAAAQGTVLGRAFIHPEILNYGQNE